MVDSMLDKALEQSRRTGTGWHHSCKDPGQHIVLSSAVVHEQRGHIRGNKSASDHAVGRTLLAGKNHTAAASIRHFRQN